MTRDYQLVLDPAIITPLAERLCIRFCRSIDVDLDGNRRVRVPIAMVGPRLALSDAAPDIAGRLVVKLATGERTGFIVLRDDDGLPGTFAWFVRDPDTEPMVDARLQVFGPAADGDLGGAFGGPAPRGAA